MIHQYYQQSHTYKAMCIGIVRALLSAMTTTQQTKTYRITASFTRDGQTQASDTAETLGEAYQRTYADRDDAESACEDLQASVAEYGLRPSTAYSVVEDSHEIEIGDVVEVTLTLGRDGMGDNADEADFDAWVVFVTDRIDEESDCDVTVEVRGPRDAQDDDIRGGDERMPGCAPGYDGNAAVGDAMTRLWEAFCADTAAWPVRS